MSKCLVVVLMFPALGVAGMDNADLDFATDSPRDSYAGLWFLGIAALYFGWYYLDRFWGRKK